MLPSIKLLIVMLVSQQCYAVSGFSLFGIKRESKEGKVIDLTPKTADLGPTELSWITNRSLNEKQLANRLAQQKLEGLSSQNNPIASLPYTSQSVLPTNFYWSDKGSLVPQYESAGLVQGSQPIPGRRRLDDNTALASNANQHLQQQQQLQVRSARLAQQEQLLLNEARQNERRLKHLQYDERMLREMQRRMLNQRQIGQQQVNRRVSMDNGGRYQGDEAMREGRRKGQRVGAEQPVTSPRAIVDNGNRQESRKRSARPLISRSKMANGVNNGDDIFNDDDGDGSEVAGSPDTSSERRSSDDDEEEDADEAEDDSQSNGQSAAGRRARGHKLSATSPTGRRQSAALNGNNPITRSQSKDIDEDIDSSNAQANTMALEGQLEDDTRREARESRGADDVAGSRLSSSDSDSTNLDESRAATQQQGQVSHSSTDLKAAAGHHHGHHGHYYQYVEVPKKKAWKFGFKRGNHKHEIEKHEKGHKHKFHTTFKWHAKEKCKKKKKCKSVGKMTWEYKHAKKHHHG